jgi:hypothetical protein
MLAGAWVALPTHAGAAASQQVDAETIRQEIIAGKAVDHDGATVDGILDLTGIDTDVTRPVHCRSCIFNDGIEAQDVVFERIVDFGGATVHGRFDLRDATFEGPFILTAVGDAGEVDAPATLAMATFLEMASFDGFHFAGSDPSQPAADFSNTRFDGVASFADARFDGTADFTNASFASSAEFPGSLDGSTRCDAAHSNFVGPAIFTHATFTGVADFHSQCFNAGAVFENATFGGEANFADAVVTDVADFQNVRFTTLAARSLRVQGEHSIANFQFAGASGPADFTSAHFDGQAIFASFRGDGLLSWRNIVVGGDFSASELVAADLRMDLSTVSRILSPDVRRAILAQMEAGAIARHDQPAANHARYKRLSIVTETTSPAARRWIRLIGFQWIAGYWVQPTNPAIVFVVLIVLGTIIRLIRWWRRSPAPPPPAPRPSGPAVGNYPHVAGLRLAPVPDYRPSTPVWAAGSRSGHDVLAASGACLGDTISVAFRADPRIPPTPPNDLSARVVTIGRWFEYLYFKALIAIFLINLANYDETLHQFIAAIAR